MTQESDRDWLLLALIAELDEKGWETGPRNPTCNYRQIPGLLAARPSLVILEISMQGGAPQVASMIKEMCPQTQLILLYPQAADEALAERLLHSYGAAAVIVIPPHMLEKEETLKAHLRRHVPPGPALVGAGSCV